MIIGVPDVVLKESEVAVGESGATLKESAAVAVCPFVSVTVYVIAGTEPAYPCTGTNM